MNHSTVLTDADFGFTPVEYNENTQHWEPAGDGRSVTIANATETLYLQITEKTG